jgi:hypothetical protein
LCGGQPSLVLYLTLEKEKEHHYHYHHYHFKSSMVGGNMERLGELVGKPCCVLALCNGKWLKVMWNQVHYFFLFVLTFRKVGKVVPS